ncbi:MAG: efflux RND transporter periplasmic adaptor subunit [Deltaproteobacteria bacterium]|nr:efflux RND transporter periplasmic adaptor subunit [Deltaproteobacteria bacterium]
MTKKILIALIVLGSIATAAFYWFNKEPEEAATAVQKERVRRATLIEQASASGTIQPDVQVEVKSRASGEVVELAVNPGDQVEKGALLVRLDPIDEERSIRESRAALISARARLAQAEASVSVARTEAKEAEARYDVRRKGFEKGLVSAEEHRSAENNAVVARNTVLLRQADVLSARAEVDRAKLAIAEAQRRLDETIIRAPITGTVLSVSVERGTIVSSGITNVGGGTTLVTLADLAKLYVVGSLDEANVGKVKPGQEVEITVDAYGNRMFRGRVERVSPLGTTTSNIVTFDVEVAVTDKDIHLLKPGMSADLEIAISRHEKVLLIPVAAVRGEGTKRFVLLASGEQRPIRTRETDGNQIIVSDGLKEGEEVIVAGVDIKAKQAGGPGLFGPRRMK